MYFFPLGLIVLIFIAHLCEYQSLGRNHHCRRSHLSSSRLSALEQKESLSNELVLALSFKGSKSFDMASKTVVTMESLTLWENEVDSLVSELKLLKDAKIILAIYSQILNKAALNILDPLQLTTFELCTNALADALIDTLPDKTPITGLIDEITEVHFQFIEKFRVAIDDGGSDGYSQSARQEDLVYQFAVLVRKFYSRVSLGMGSAFDQSQQAQIMRLESWLAPINARLQRRFVRFSPQDIDEKAAESLEPMFHDFLERLSLDISPKHTLHHVWPSVFSAVGLSSKTSEYRAWDLASFIVKVFRNVLVTSTVTALEPLLTQLFQNSLSTDMHSLGQPLEKIGRSKANLVDLSEKGRGQIERMLNIAHTTVAAVYTLWHVRHNLVGVPDPNNPSNMVKDYLRPVSIKTVSLALDSLPKSMRRETEALVHNYCEALSSITGQVAVHVVSADTLQEADDIKLEACDLSSNSLLSFAVLANAVRETASAQFRALITYNSNPDMWPESRDDSYIAVLTAVISEALLGGSAYPMDTFYEHLVSMAVLEESMAVREPRAACGEAFVKALRTASAAVSATETLDNKLVDNFAARVLQVEAGLVLALRLPADVSTVIRKRAFEANVKTVMESDKYGGFGAALKEVSRLYPTWARMLSIRPTVAKSIIEPLGFQHFDKAIGSLLMSADLAVSMDSMSAGVGDDDMAAAFREMYIQQLQDLAGDCMIPLDVARQRVGFLAGSVLLALLQAALEENRRSGLDRAESLLSKSFYMYEHPLMKELSSDGVDLKALGAKMVAAKLGPQVVTELMRLVDGLRQRIQKGGEPLSSDQGWGRVPISSEPKNPKFAPYLAAMQLALMKEYSIITMKQR